MKKLISVILAGVMMAGLCACGIVDLGKKGRETTEEEVEPVTATTTAETTTETTAAAKEPTEATEDVVESTVASDKVRADEVPIKALRRPQRIPLWRSDDIYEVQWIRYIRIGCSDHI